MKKKIFTLKNRAHYRKKIRHTANQNTPHTAYRPNTVPYLNSPAWWQCNHCHGLLQASLADVLQHGTTALCPSRFHRLTTPKIQTQPTKKYEHTQNKKA